MLNGGHLKTSPHLSPPPQLDNILAPASSGDDELKSMACPCPPHAPASLVVYPPVSQSIRLW